MLVTVMGVLVVLYARYYMAAQDPVPRFFSFLLAFMGSMLGVVLSGNLIQLVVFWELTSLTSFMLIGYWYHRLDARRGARMALTVTAAGGLCLLAGMLLLGRIVGKQEVGPDQERDVGQGPAAASRVEGRSGLERRLSGNASASERWRPDGCQVQSVRAGHSDITQRFTPGSRPAVR
jgi:formate hydrogenlyase subunit 3/multisubunit Na+/H+ antiporter MnhD subunit